MAQELVRPVSVKIQKRLWLWISLAALPVVLLALFYILKNRTDVMDWTEAYVSAPLRDVASRVSSLAPFRTVSLTELLITILGVWALYFILRTIVNVITKPGKLYTLGKRLYILALVILYIWSGYSWLWGTGYHSTGFAEESGLVSDGTAVEELIRVANLFAEKANELSTQVTRDKEGHFAEDRQSYFAAAEGIYDNIVTEFPTLQGHSYPPKPMIYSKLMSSLGFTGVYMALTGETNINIDAPASLIPATIAHEMAHQHGINAEEEANFVGIAASITSGNTVYEYSGYLAGLIYLMNALYKADPEAASSISSGFTKELGQDWKDNNDYWTSFEPTPAAEAVTAMYDSYLKSNGQSEGIASYGACVDLLASWLG
jgi:hypothetical protein